MEGKLIFTVIFIVCVLASLLTIQQFFTAVAIRDINLEGQCNLQLQSKSCTIVPENPIFGLDVLLPVDEIHGYFDYQGARECLRDKKILMLGDSTMTELTDDLILLLANGSQDERNYYIHNRCTRGVYTFNEGETLVNRSLPAKAHRQLFAHCGASNTSLRLHYTGHYNIFDNRYGIQTFFHPRFYGSFEDYLLWEPDIIIVNSGLHDVYTSPSTFRWSVRRLANQLRESNATVLWKGTILLVKDLDGVPSREQLLKFDSIAREEFQDKGLNYVDVAHVMQQIYCSPRMRESELLTIGDMIHYGEEFYRKYRHATTLFQAYTTQAVLNSICS